MPFLTCSRCGKVFAGRRYHHPTGGRRYCSGVCRQKAFQQRRVDRIVASARRDLLIELGLPTTKEDG